MAAGKATDIENDEVSVHVHPSDGVVTVRSNKSNTQITVRTIPGGLIAEGGSRDSAQGTVTEAVTRRHELLILED